MDRIETKTSTTTENSIPDQSESDSELIESESAYRDSIATVDASGKRVWIYPKKPRGRLHRARVSVAIFLVAVFFTGPFIKISGQPLLLLNVLKRRFVILGQPFWTQDFHIFVLAMITAIVFILLFTVIYGRIFCGWICPQTVFMEMVFRKIEYLIEGDAASQRALNKKRWTFGKITRKTLKQAMFFGLSFLVANTFMAYLVGIEEFFIKISSSPAENPSAFLGVTFFSSLFYFIFARFREQACILVCPYGRLQGVMLDKKSIVVSYDFIRGEPRTIIRKARDNPDAGDCIDCRQCLHVCPTGIDIRYGTQLECVNCTACIDACNAIMRKVNRAEGLIRYASHDSISSGESLKLTGRMIGYSSVLLVLLLCLGYLTLTRTEIETTILRTPGVFYKELEDGRIRNLYSLKIVNKSLDNIPIELQVGSPGDGIITLVSGSLIVPANEVLQSAFFVDLPNEQLTDVSTRLRILVLKNGALVETVKTTFLGPVQ